MREKLIFAGSKGLDGLYLAVVAGNVVPIYEYQCQSCQETFEYMQRMSEDAKTECEACKGKLERIISNTSFALKGGGWYKDLYSSTKKDSKSSSDSSSSDSSSASSSSEGAASSSEASSSGTKGDSGTSKSASDSGSSATSTTSSTPAKASAGTKGSD